MMFQFQALADMAWAACSVAAIPEDVINDLHSMQSFLCVALRLTLGCVLTAVMYEVYYLSKCTQRRPLHRLHRKRTTSILLISMACCFGWSIITNLVIFYIVRLGIPKSI